MVGVWIEPVIAQLMTILLGIWTFRGSVTPVLRRPTYGSGHTTLSIGASTTASVVASLAHRNGRPSFGRPEHHIAIMLSRHAELTAASFVSILR
jgi:hypothetical protein